MPHSWDPFRTIVLASCLGFVCLIVVRVTASSDATDLPAATSNSVSAEKTKAVREQDAAKPATSIVPSQRTFRFVYGVTITNLPRDKTARVWIPVAMSNAHQVIEIENTQIPVFEKTVEKTYGNTLIYFEAQANARGEIPIDVTYKVTRREVLPHTGERIKTGQRKKFLVANSLVPVGEKSVSLFDDSKKPSGTALEVARTLYGRVDDHVKYDKPPNGKWGRGDVVWVCDSKYGNCSDFHSLFISLCRSYQIPARFEIGFPIPTDAKKGEVGGYHCWAYFANERQWLPVDISEADKHPEMKEYYFGHLTADRVAFTTGRDLTLEPQQESGPVNFLVYPHVEVDGVAHTSFVKRFRYEDIR